ncbi:MAG: MlaD family protein [Pseudomonadota bacterium]
MSLHEAPQLEVKHDKSRRISAVWIVPAIAAILAGLVGWQALSDRGPLVEVRFQQAKGIKPGKTEIKHKDVVVGVVENVVFADDLNGVIVTARLALEIEPYLGDKTDFWVVSANVSAGNLTGLDTILSGSYIEVDWSGPPNQTRRKFVGLDKQPLTPPSTKGQHFRIKAPNAGSLGVGSPVYFRGIKVGKIESRELSDDYASVLYETFIDAPYDELIGVSTVFWNVSGFRLETKTDGLALNVASIEALLSGGVAFTSLSSNLSNASPEETQVFSLYPNEAAALESRFIEGNETGVSFRVSFQDSVGGLEPGAPVEWQGIRIGTVLDLKLNPRSQPADRLVDVIIELQPSRVGLDFDTNEDAQNSIQEWVDSGMRVRLATGNILTGRKVVRFEDGVDSTPFVVDFENDLIPRLPTAASGLDVVAEDAETLMATLAELPLDDLVSSAVRLLDNSNAFVGSPELQRLPFEFNTTLGSVGSAAARLDLASQNIPQLVESLDDIANAGEAALIGVSPDSTLYVDLAGAVRELRNASRSLSDLARQLEQQPNSLIMGRD